MSADKDTKANLGCLEEDDEFEEFPVEGKHTHTTHNAHNKQNTWIIITDPQMSHPQNETTNIGKLIFVFLPNWNQIGHDAVALLLLFASRVHQFRLHFLWYFWWFLFYSAGVGRPQIHYQQFWLIFICFFSSLLWFIVADTSIGCFWCEFGNLMLCRMGRFEGRRVGIERVGG